MSEFRRRVLILGGTGEAVALARACGPRSHVVYSLAGCTRAPSLASVETRIGGFGGAAGLAEFLQERQIERLVDATHPFAIRIGAHAAQACEQLGVPRVRLLRPSWRPVAGDRWLEVDDLSAAARRLPALARRAFLTVGRRDLDAFAGLDLWLLVRTIEPPKPLPLRRAHWLAGRGPFRTEDEVALLRAHRISGLVTKASGGSATYAKLAAARKLGLPVLMVRRPAPPRGPMVDSVEAALLWLERA